MKVIFLDVDGVLNYGRNELFLGKCVFSEHIALLKQIVDSTNAKIVLSSSWRRGWYLQQHDPTNRNIAVQDFQMLKYQLSMFGIALLDYTAEFNHRGKEISHWLNQHSDNGIDSYVILDDMNEEALRPHTKHLVQTNPATGLTPDNVQKAIQILNKYNQ